MSDDAKKERTSEATEVVDDLLKTAEEYMGEFEGPMDRGVCYAMLVHLRKRAYTLGFLRTNSATKVCGERLGSATCDLSVGHEGMHSGDTGARIHWPAQELPHSMFAAPVVDSPNFVPKAAEELAARGFDRVNDPRSTSATTVCAYCKDGGELCAFHRGERSSDATDTERRAQTFVHDGTGDPDCEHLYNGLAVGCRKCGHWRFPKCDACEGRGHTPRTDYPAHWNPEWTRMWVVTEKGKAPRWTSDEDMADHDVDQSGGRATKTGPFVLTQKRSDGT